MTVNRKLAAIFYADVAGYSRLTGRDEEGTHQRVMAMLDRATERIGKSGGTVLRYAGDAILATFPSVVDAVNTAAAIQVERAEANADVDSDDRVELRIGINLGDVIEDRGEIFGDGVNLAARLEAAAVPGGICISAAAHEQVVRHTDVSFSGGSEETFKNIDRPIRVWRWSPGGSSQPAPSRAARPSQPPAVAVLPFVNMSGDPEQEYFSDGLTEDIITALSHWRSIPVIARNSTFIYKNRAVAIREVAEALGVRYVLEGSVRKSGARLRITAQLIDSETGHHVWAEKYDRELADVFDIQDELTGRIAAIVVPEVQQSERRRLAAKRTEDFDAWDLYLKGLEGFFSDTCAGLRAAQPLFAKAVEADPGFCDAWARLGWTHAKLVMQACSDDPAADLAAGFRACRKALEIDSASALAHLALGTVYIWSEETEEGTQEALRAVELNPHYTEALIAAGNRLDLLGRSAEGIDMVRRGLELNPRDPARWRYVAYLSRAAAASGDMESAIAWAHETVALRPDNAEAQFRYAVIMALADRPDEARTALEKCEAILPGYVARKSDWRPYPDDARNRIILDGLRRHGLIAG